jgi:hypothetical protein
MGLSFNIAAGSCQRSCSPALVPRDSWSYFTVSGSKLPQPGGLGPHIYIPQHESDPGIPPGTGFPFRRLLRLAGIRWKYSNPPPHGQEIHKQETILWYDTDHIENDASSNSSIVMCTLCHRNVTNKPLPSNDRGIHMQTHKLRRGVYEILRRDGFRCHNTHTNFHTYWFRPLKLIRGGDTTIQRQQGVFTCLLSFSQNKESRLVISRLNEMYAGHGSRAV